MTDHFLEDKINGQCDYLMQMLFADEAASYTNSIAANRSSYQIPPPAIVASSSTHPTTMPYMYKQQPFVNNPPAIAWSNPPPVLQPNQQPVAWSNPLPVLQPYQQPLAWSNPPPVLQPHQQSIAARRYVLTATGDFHVEDTVIDKLPKRILQQQRFKDSNNNNTAEVGEFSMHMANLDIEPMSPKPTTFREKLIDKFGDVYKVLSRLSAQKFEQNDSGANDSSDDESSTLGAVQYAPYFMRMPGASLADFWNYLYAGLNGEYDLVAEVTKTLERRCSDRDGLPDDLVPSQVLAELAAQVEMFADTKTLGILSATGSIDVEKENEVNILLEMLDKLFLCIRMASTNIWLLRTIVLCTRERPVAPQTPPPRQPNAASRVKRIRRYGA